MAKVRGGVVANMSTAKEAARGFQMPICEVDKIALGVAGLSGVQIEDLIFRSIHSGQKHFDSL